MQPKTKQILTLKANGMLSKQIAAKMNIHRRTVEWHLRKAYFELGAVNTAHAVALSMKKGLILASEIGCIFLLCWAGFAGEVDSRRGPALRNMSRTARREVLV